MRLKMSTINNKYNSLLPVGDAVAAFSKVAMADQIGRSMA